VNLVVLCGEKPTKSLLERMALNLPVQLAAVAAEERYEVRRDIQAASLIVSTPENKKPRQRSTHLPTHTFHYFLTSASRYR
jgi:zinc finger RNA-binding protein